MKNVLKYPGSKTRIAKWICSYIPEHDVYKEAQIENQDALKLIERYNKKEVFIYADPPYPLFTRKNYLYEHEMSDSQHINLLRALKKHEGKVLISSYENYLYDKELQGWHKEFKNAVAENSVKRVECLYMNYEINQNNSFFE